MMRYSQSEKMEIVRVVEGSELSVRQTLRELDVNRSSFYHWYKGYMEKGFEGLSNRKPGPTRFWNKIPQSEKKMVVSMALETPEKSPRELAWHITDTQGYYISESSVYRILKSYDLISSPAYIVISAADKFTNPTLRVNELWQTDFTYFKIIGWGWYYLSSVLDDYSRYIISWKLFSSMTADDVTQTLDMAIKRTGVNEVKIRHRPRLLSDNGPCYVSGYLREYLENQGMQHTRGAPYHPMTQGKIERYHRTMKNVINLQKYYLPWELEKEIETFVNHYNNQRYHESLNNMIPRDVFNGKEKYIQTKRDKIKMKTLIYRKQLNLSKSNLLIQYN